MSPSRRDLCLLWSLRAVATLTGALVLLIIGFLVSESSAVLARLGPSRFFADPSWHPTEALFDLTPMVVGTLAVTAGALLIAAPLGVLSAVFRQVYAPPAVARWYGRLIELLAGIPSVVYGLWGLTVLVPLIGRLHPPGPSLLAGALIVALMVLPTIALLSDAAIASVPQSQRQGAAALGLSRWGMARGVLLPAARPGVATGVLLGVGRAIGETMAVLMVCGNVVQLPDSVFAPVRTLTANIALEMGYALGDHRGALFVSGLVLMALVVGLVLAADRLGGRAVHG